MKHSSLKAKRKTALPDRKFIIAVIIVTSALSFSLGYFVGGAGEKGKQPEYQIIATPKLEAITQVQEYPPLADASDNAPQIASASGGASQPEAASGDSLERKEGKAQLQKPLLGPSLQLPVQPAAKKEPAEPKVETDNSRQDDMKYTVQAGAFKNLKEAETLKHKLETKGYKAYIKKYAKSKNPKLYKVRIGEFAAKEGAAALALKLKNEGLKAFVTLKDEEALGDKNSSQPSAAKKENIR